MVTQQPTRGERGQLVLIAAILVATAIVGAVVLLNAVHSSPDVKAQTDAQSLADAERTVGEIQRDLRAVFFATNATDSGQHPFAKEDDLEESTKAYNDQVGNFTAREGVAVQSATLTDQSVNGSFVGGDFSGSVSPVIEDADSIPYLQVTASTAPVELTIERGAETRDIRLASDAEYDDPSGTMRTCSGLSGPITLELTRGSGEIRGADGEFCEIDVYDPSDAGTYDVSITSGGDGRFAISGGGDSINTGSGVTAETGIVNPTFDVSYTDPSVTYDGNVTLFEGDDR